MVLQRTSYSRIGVDLGSRQMKAIQFSRHGAKRALAAAAAVERRVTEKLDDADLARLVAALNSQGFHGREVVVACPPAMVHTDILELPSRASGAPIRQIAQVEMQRSSRFDGGFEMAFWDLPSGPRAGSTSSVMATAIKQSDAQTLLEQLDRAGLEVAAMETTAIALARAMSAGKSNDITAAVDAGASASSLMLVHQGTIIYQRPLNDISLALLHRSIGAEFEVGEAEQSYLVRETGLIDSAEARRDAAPQERRLQAMLLHYADAIADEVETALAYAAHRYPQLQPGDVVLSGGGAAIPGIDKHVAKRVTIEVRVGRPADSLTFHPSRADQALSPVYLPAVGLAMNESD
jgi:type IV pilus assembly protein PilM